MMNFGNAIRRRSPFVRLSRMALACALGAWPLAALAAEAEPTEALPELGDRYKSLESLARGLFYLESLYVDPAKVTQEKMVLSALQGVVSKLDPHTMIMPSKAFEQLTIDTQGRFGGVGIIVSSERGKLIVVSPIEDTPAYRAGVKAGDEIVAIDGTPINKLSAGEATEKMRGAPDSVLRLTVKRKDEPKTLDFKLVREIIKVHSVRSQDLGNDVMYARIASFQDNTTDELQAALEKRKGKIKGLVLDLRDNPGGLLDQAARVSDLFIESGVIVSTVGRNPDNVEREFAHKRGTYADFPIVTLINGGSASASEIVAGALQDHERSLIVGTTSFGKGSVQTLVSLPDRSGLKITVARYYTPKDRSIQAKGIQPDVYVDNQGETPVKAKDEREQRRKESDLKGHIESHDLSDLARSAGMVHDTDEWPEAMRDDKQLVTAYTYLRGWNLFNRKSLRSNMKPSPEEPAVDSKKG